MITGVPGPVVGEALRESPSPQTLSEAIQGHADMRSLSLRPPIDRHGLRHSSIVPQVPHRPPFCTTESRIMKAFKMRLRFVAPALLLAGLGVITTSSEAGASTATFTSAEVGSSGNTADFTQSGPWTMAWTYDCSAFGSQGNFSVDINQPAGDETEDLGTNELGDGGSGTDYYYDTGTFSLSVISECDWSITVTSSSAGSLATPVTFASGQTGVTGNPQEFTVGSKWTMAWTYDCTAFRSQGNFSVDINQPAGDETVDIGPNELGTGGSGTDSYDDTGTFSLDVLSECDWSITVNSAGSPTPTPTPSPSPAVAPGAITGMATTPDDAGYWIINALGDVSGFGDAVNYGSTAGTALNGSIVGIAATPDGKGYWLVASNGGIFTFGDAAFYGSMGGTPLNKPVVGMAATPDGKGYWLVASDGGIFSFGDAQFYGSTGAIHLNQPIVGIAVDPATGGYWMVASDGGIFSFNAPFLGSMGGTKLNKPVVGMAVDPSTDGYWLVASDGGIFSFNAPFFGSTGGIVLNKPIVGMEAATSGSGYRFVASDGGIFDFGSSQFYGSGA
jgi:hypothetical protein